MLEKLEDDTFGFLADFARRPGGTSGEEAGAELPFGCRMGICHTCVGKLCSGKLRDLRTGEVRNYDPVRSAFVPLPEAADDRPVELRPAVAPLVTVNPG